MDINSNLSLYTDIYSTNNESAKKLENTLNNGMKQATDEELMDACKQFEAYFVEQMFKSMVKTIPKNEAMSGSTSSLMDYYTDEMIQELAADSTEQNGLGLAQMLYEQMKRNYDL